MSTTPAPETVTEAAARVHGAERAQRDAIGAPFKAGASLRRIATKVLLSHEPLRRIVQDRERESPGAIEDSRGSGRDTSASPRIG